MVILVLVVAVVVSVALAGGLAYLAWRLWQLDADVKQLDQDCDRLWGALRTAHDQHVQTIEGRLLAIENQLAWAVPWVQFWAGSQAAQDELARRRRDAGRRG